MFFACKTTAHSSESEVKNYISEGQLYLVQTDIANNCCPKALQEEVYLSCIQETAKKREPDNYIPVIKELSRRAETHKKTFTQWVCSDIPPAEVY
jgi:hypothetical protein